MISLLRILCALVALASIVLACAPNRTRTDEAGNVTEVYSVTVSFRFGFAAFSLFNVALFLSLP